MTPPDPTPLRRAAYALLLVSMARYAWASVERSGTISDSDADAPGHLTASDEKAKERARAAEPLGAGARVDPNQADAVQLDRLPGIGPATAAAIIDSRTEGLVFRDASDLVAVPGIGPSTVEKMAPWLTFEGASVASSGAVRERRRPSPAPARGVGSVDVNRASALELERLPRIGPAIAARIVQQRARRPFSSVEDLARVSGIGPATIEAVRPWVRAGGSR